MKKNFEELLKIAQDDPNVLGLILQGSRGKGFDTTGSDYDVQIVVKDGVEKEYEKKFKKNVENADAWTNSFSQLKASNAWGGPDHWDRYDYLHVKIVVDKTDGLLQKICDEKGHIPPEKQKEFVSSSLDAYINGVFRSVKCIKNKNTFGAHLEAVNSMLDLLTVVFALEGRHRPFLSYVGKELTAYPLKLLPWPADEFVSKIEKVLATADFKTQQELLIGIEKLARTTGYGRVFDDWEGKDKWAMEYKP